MLRSEPVARPVEPRPASTVLVVRDQAGGAEVLLLRRPASGFAADSWVFPGGVVDDEDASLPPPGPNEPARWAEVLGLGDAAVAWGYLAAAFRETWEETGLLLGRSSATEQELEGARRALLQGRESYPSVVARLRMVPRTESMIYLSRWITPVDQPKRFDTRFFVAECRGRTGVTLEGSELEEARWIRPGEAVALHAAGELRMMTPTVHSLERIARYDSVPQMLDGLTTHRPTSYLPRIRRGPDGVIIDLEEPDS